MTKSIQIEGSKDKIFSIGNLCFGFFCVFALLLILRNSQIAIEYMNQGLSLCAKTVVPSLFPFMVLSEMIVSGGLGSKAFQKMSRPFQRLFRLPADGCCAVALGLLCGFPVGAKCTVLALEQGKLTRDEAERTLAFSNNPSSAFLVSAIGSSLWGNAKLGWTLYGTSLATALLTGALLSLFAKREEEAVPPVDFNHVIVSASPIKIFCNAVRSALWSILNVCAYVVFFCALVGTLRHLPLVQSLPEAAKAFLFCLFELSSGASQAAALAPSLTGACLTAFAVGWSGLSVHCQILSVCDGKALSMRTYFFSKFFQAALCPMLFALVLSLFPALLIPGSSC